MSARDKLAAALREFVLARGAQTPRLITMEEDAASLRAILANHGLAALPVEPTEKMLDAPRGLFLYFAMPPGSMTLGEHLAEGGYPTAGLTPEQLAYGGVFPKAERAAMVYAMMLAAAKEDSNA